MGDLSKEVMEARRKVGPSSWLVYLAPGARGRGLLVLYRTMREAHEDRDYSGGS